LPFWQENQIGQIEMLLLSLQMHFSGKNIFFFIFCLIFAKTEALGKGKVKTDYHIEGINELK